MIFLINGPKLTFLGGSVDFGTNYNQEALTILSALESYQIDEILEKK